MAFADTVKEHVSNLETKHYYVIGGIIAVVIIIIVLLVALSGFPGERFGDSSHEGEVARLVFNDTGTRLASSERNPQAKAMIWDLAAGKLVQTVDGNKNDSRMIAFSPDGKVLVTVGLDEHARFWDIGTGSERRYLKVPLSAVSALSPDGTWLVYSKGPKTFVCNLKLSKADYHEFKGSATGSSAMTFSPDSKQVAMGDASGVLWIYEPETKNLKVPRKGHESAIACVGFSPDGKVIGTASRDHTTKLWNTDGEEIIALEGHEDAVEVVAVGPGAALVLTGSRDGTARLWLGESGKEKFKFENFRGKSQSRAAISADGSLAAIETAGSGVEIFETSSGTSVVKIEVPVSTFAFAPKGSTLYFGRASGKLYTWTKGMK